MLPASLLNGEPQLDANDLAEFVYQISINYGLSSKEYNFKNAKSPERKVLESTFLQCKALGYSKREFYERLAVFLRTNQYGMANFQAHFFEDSSNRKALHNREWLNKQLKADEDACKNIVGYLIPIGNNSFYEGFMYVNEFEFKGDYQVIYPDSPYYRMLVMEKIGKKFTVEAPKVQIIEKYIAPSSNEALKIEMENGKLTLENKSLTSELKRMEKLLESKQKELKQVQKQTEKLVRKKYARVDKKLRSSMFGNIERVQSATISAGRLHLESLRKAATAKHNVGRRIQEIMWRIYNHESYRLRASGMFTTEWKPGDLTVGFTNGA